MREQFVDVASRAIQAIAPEVAIQITNNLTPRVVARIIAVHQEDEYFMDPGNNHEHDLGGISVSCHDRKTKTDHRVGVKYGEIVSLDGSFVWKGSKEFALAKRLFAQRREEMIQDRIEEMLQEQKGENT